MAGEAEGGHLAAMSLRTARVVITIVSILAFATPSLTRCAKAQSHAAAAPTR